MEKNNKTISILISAGILFISWLFVFRFSLSNDLYQADLVIQHLVTIFNKNGIPDVYNFSQLGGTLLRPLYGYIPLEGFLSFLISNEIKVMTIMAVILCFLNGIWSWLGIRNLSTNNLSIPLSLLTIIIFTFLPISAWRITSGHLNFLMGINLVCLLFYYGTSLYRNDDHQNYLFDILVLLVLMNIMSHPPIAQIFFYICIFFIPVFFFLNKRNNSVRRRIPLFLIGCFLLVLLNWDQLFLFLKYQLSNEFPRSGEPTLYSYLKLEPRHFISVFISSLGLLNKIGINPGVIHEINYPIGLGGTILVLKYLAKESRKIVLIISFMLFLLFLYIAGIPVIEDFFKMIPIVNMFRVPSRILILVSFLSSVYLVFNLLKDAKSFTVLDYLALFIMFPAVLYDSFFLELAFVTCALLSFKFGRKLAVFSLILFCLLNIASFRERVQVFRFNPDSRSSLIKKISKKTRSDIYETTDIISYDRNLLFNTAAFYGLSSIEGYNTPLKNFLSLYSFLSGEEYAATRLSFDLSGDAKFNILRNLYNINLSLDISKRKKMITRDIENPESRSPINIHYFDDEKNQLSHIKANYGELSYLRDHVSLSERIPDKRLKRCHYKKFKPGNGQGIQLSPESQFPCLIVLPFNYSSFLETDNKSAKILPVDLALTGIYLESKPVNNKIAITEKYNFETYIKAKIILWGILFLALTLYYFRDVQKKSLF